MNQRTAQGIRLFNAQKYFEAHEALEEVWLGAEGTDRTLLHGLIQVAAAFHHYQQGNMQGFHRLLEKGARKLDPFDGVFEGIDITHFKSQLAPWRMFPEQGIVFDSSQLPPLPVISMNENQVLP